ncbi:hypothetical protein M0R04_06670 [Candidatus Dojkabacteria bacterium]|jgi:hypothetical protein|nr:hypothetical protein [Candidatus Dojkabacteria bacterium]
MSSNLQEIPKEMFDPKFFLENFCKIKTKSRHMVPFILNEAQKDLFNALVFQKVKRVILLKARQLGFSTAVCGFLYHDTIMNPGTTSVIIGYNREMTTELLEKIKLFYATTPVKLQPTIKYNSRHEISFPVIGSKIIVLPSNESVGRGYTINNLLCTELALWEKAEEKMTTLEASVPIDGRIIIESTPHGIGNKYHEMWVADNDYLKKEYGWWWGYTKEEVDTIRKRLNNEQLFAQEYGLTFLTSGRLVFDREALEKQRKNILKVGDKISYENSDAQLEEKDVRIFEDLRIYKPPVSDGLYIFGVDNSEGVEGGDFTAVTVLDRRTGEEVAFYRGLITPDHLALKLNQWGRFYNNALMVIEINNHGLTTIMDLKKLIYPNMYHRPKKFDVVADPISEKLGWKTSRVTKPLMIGDLDKALREDSIMFHSKETLDEMLTYVYNDSNEMVPMSKKYHDDCIMSAALAIQGFKVMYDKPLDQIDYTLILPKTFAY